MLVFRVLLGAAIGIHLMQTVWRLFGWGVGEVSIAVPVGGTLGAVVGALLGLVRDPRVGELLMAVIAGAAAGAVAGRLPWGAVGEIGGLGVGGLAAGAAWAGWWYFERRAGQGRRDPAEPGDNRTDGLGTV
jgi:hypothetical protein